MKAKRLLLLCGLMLPLVVGCRGGMPPKRTMAANEPMLDVGGESGTKVTTNPAIGAPTTTIVDRHPLFSRPRDYYENSGENKIVKTAAATVIGIPAGVVGEIKQIVVGAPDKNR